MILFITLAAQIFIVHGLTCSDILELPDDRKLTLSDLQTTQPKEIVLCLAHVGKERLPKEETGFIWESIVTHYGGVPNIPDSVLMLLHWITPALTPEDYINLTLSNIDVIQNFGLHYGLEQVQLEAIADRVREDFAGKQPEDFSFYDLVALRQILCAFNQSEIERIHPAAYREAAGTIGKLENCKPEVWQGFAHLAVQDGAFGPPSQWSESVLQIIGKVAEHMPQGTINNIKISKP